MKDSLLEMLLNLFEKTLAQLKEQQTPAIIDTTEEQSAESSNQTIKEPQYELIAQPNNHSLRIFTNDERLKLTKASYQFLMRMVNLGVLTHDVLERVIHRMFFSDSRFVSLQETKWAIRQTLADTLSAEQLAFLDLVLYQSEDGMALH